MAQKNPFDNILGQISDMLSMIHKNRDKKLSGEGLTPEMQSDMALLEGVIEMYNDIAAKALKLTGESPEQLKKKISEQKTALSPEQQKFLKKSEKLKQEIADLQSSYYVPQEAFDQQKKKLVKKKIEKKFGDERKKKFKRLSGGDKGWMPL